MSTEYFNDQWRIPSNENQNKISNYSMEFDNVANNSISLGNTLTNGFSKLTVSVWANFSSLPGTARGLISKDLANQRSFEIRYNTSGVDFIVSTNGTQIFSSSVYPRNSINIGQWYHFVGVYDGSNILFYVDGTLIGTPTALTGSLQNTTSELNIGLRSASPSNTTFDGKIDQVSIFDYALPATGTNSVATLYGGGTAVTNPMALSPKPIAAYQLGDQSVDNGANYLVPNNSLSDYVFNFSTPALVNFGTTIANFDRTDPFTFSIWIKTSSNATNQYVISKQIPAYLGSMILLDSNMRLGIILGATATDRIYFKSNSAIPSNEWVHLAWTYDGSSSYSGMSVYVNGSPFATSVVNDSLTLTTVNTGQLNISGRDGSSHREVDGELSSFSIFDTELTSNEVNSIYNNGSPNDISSLNPIAWYKLNAADTFNSSTGNWTINDYGSGGNDGTSSGMTSANLVQSDLQQTSGYSPYALDFDGTNDILDCGNANSLSISGDLTISAWVNIDANPSGFYGVISKRTSATVRNYEVLINSSGKVGIYVANGGVATGTVFDSVIPINTWVSIVITIQSGVTNGAKLFLNGSQDAITGTQSISADAANFLIGARGPASSPSSYTNGTLSNIAIWNSALTSTQVTEIFNSGRPSNLNNFSGTAPVAWWQLGSNSSFNTNWTCLDEIGSSNAVSVNMTNDDITNGVGYSANGLGTSSIDIVGDAPYSTANGLSENMDVLDRSTDVPS